MPPFCEFCRKPIRSGLSTHLEEVHNFTGTWKEYRALTANEQVWIFGRLAMKGKLPILPKELVTHIVDVGRLGPDSKLTILSYEKQAAVQLSAAVRAALARMR